MKKEYTPIELWEKIFNTDIEEAFLEMNDLIKDFDDMGTDEENAEILEVLENKTLASIVDDYLQYMGYGIYASDLHYLLINLLDCDIDDIKNFEE